VVPGEGSIALTEIAVVGWHCTTLQQMLALYRSEAAAHVIDVADASAVIPRGKMHDIDGIVAWSERQAQP
jgi:hypothetical protein